MQHNYKKNKYTIITAIVVVGAMVLSGISQAIDTVAIEAGAPQSCIYTGRGC